MIYELKTGLWVRTLDVEDLDGPYPTWFEDQEATKFNSHGKFPVTRGQLREFIESQGDGKSVVWAVCAEGQGHVGNVALQGIDSLHRRAEFAIFLGSQRSSGIGTSAGLALLRHGFLKLNLNKIFCGTASENQGMIALAGRLGMREEGRRRDHLYLNGTWNDQVEFGVLRDEWLEKHG